MPTSQPKLRRGRIVRAEIPDANRIRKERPVVILTPTDEIPNLDSLVVIAITTTFPEPPPGDHVELPWHPRSHPVTRLKRRSAAVAKWIVRIAPDDIRSFGGDVPKAKLKEIDKKISELDQS